MYNFDDNGADIGVHLNDWWVDIYATIWRFNYMHTNYYMAYQES